MIERWLSTTRLCEITGWNKTTVLRHAKEEKWKCHSQTGRGGERYCYYLADLPEYVQLTYATSLQTTLEALRNELKPPSKAPVQHVISGYKGYGSAAKDLKQEDSLDEVDRKIASLRTQILQAYGTLGMKAAEFARTYSNGLIATDIRARLAELSPRDASLSRSKLYDWLERFAQGGVFGLAHQYKDRGGMGTTLTQEEKDRLEWLWLDPNKPSVKQVLRILQDSFQVSIGEATAYRYLNSIPKFSRHPS